VAALDDAQAALLRCRQHLAAAQRITRCGSWELELGDLSDIDANPLRWSDEVFRIFGYEPGAIAVSNENFYRAVHPDDRERIGAAVREAIETGTLYSIDHRVIRPDGSIRIVHEQSEVQYDAAGRPARMIGTVHDVTEQRTTEAQFAFRDRMVSVGTLAAGVAHEINNPLAAVCANLELLAGAVAELAERAEIPPEVHDRIRNASEGADRVRAIVRDLMVLSRIDELRRAAVDVTSVLESALRMALHELRGRARVIREYGRVPPVDGNEARLGQVFLNLIRNAAQAIPGGDPERHHIRIACATDERGRVVVAISDTGCGIPPELRPQIFAPFVTTKPPGEGTGLGLSICQRIVASLGGEIDFTSELGRGTEFRVTLPPRAAEPPEPAPDLAPAAASPARSRVLVLDDEATIAAVLADLLAEGHDVAVLTDAVAARDAFVAGARYDAVLCDLMMPRLDGMELHALLRRIAPEQAGRMIIMTGGACTPEAQRFLETSGVRWIEKPFRLDELHRAIGAVTRRGS
jgi:PAS domain S-box-containing protein